MIKRHVAASFPQSPGFDAWEYLLEDLAKSRVIAGFHTLQGEKRKDKKRS